MRTPRDLPPSLTAPAFTTGDARGAGVGPRRLRARDLHHPFHGVHLVTAPTSVQDLCRAYLPLAPDGAWYSHETAAVLLGIPLPLELRHDRLHVSVAFPRTPPRGRGVVGHSLGTVTGEVVDGLPVCAPAHVWCQLSGVLGPHDLVAAGDHLLGARSRRPMVTLSDLADASEQLARTKGARARQWALARVRFGVDSRPETLLRLLLEEHGFGEIEVNRAVAVAGGRLTLHPDLSIAKLGLAFEYEGDGHRVDRRQWHHDIERRELFEAEGWRVIRVTATDLADRRAFFARLHRFVPNERIGASKATIRDES